MKKIFLLMACQLCVLVCRSQTTYNNSFDNLSLQTYTTGNPYTSTSYTNVPLGFTLINDGWINNPGTAANPNRPFHVTGFNTTGWAVVYNSIENDTFLVSTSWLDTTGIFVDRWALTPPLSNFTGNSVLTWLAKSPDSAFPDGYEVYGTTNAAASSPQDFTIGDRLFIMPDGNTAGGGEKSTWTRRSIPLGSFAGQTLRFAFRENSKNMYQIWIDDIQVVTLPNNIDGALSSKVSKKYLLTSIPDSVSTTFSNMGAATISSITLAYKVGNSSVNTEVFSFTGLAYGQSSPIQFSLPYSISQPGFYQLKSWIISVNGQADQVATNDTASYFITVQDSTPRRTVLFEQFTSANNGDGPDAQDRGLALQSDSVIVVNIHDLDSLKETNSAALLSDYKINFATAMVNRTYFQDAGTVAADRPFYADHITAAHRDSVTPVSVSILNTSFNAVSRQLSFTLKANFVGEVRGDYRLNAYLTENQVGGIFTSGLANDTAINGYNQWNGSYDVPWSPYYLTGVYSADAGSYLLPYPVFRHQNTLVYAFDGAYGNSGLIPSTGGTQGQSYQQTFSLTLPPTRPGVYKFYPDNLHIVGFVAEYDADKNNRRVLNAVQEKLTSNPEFVGIRELSLSSALFVYPNPSEGIFYFNSRNITGDYTIQVIDLYGKCVYTTSVANNSSLTPLNLTSLNSGLYFLKITSGTQNFSEKVILQKDGN